MNLTRIVVSTVFALTLCVFCLSGCDSGDASSEQTFNMPIQNEYPGLLTAAQEEEIAQTIELMNLLSYRATVLVNSTLFADFYRTSPDVIKARGQAAITAIDDYNNAAAYLTNLETQYILPIVQALKVRKAQSGTGDLLHASRLIDLYMNDDAFYKKYKLSDIARRTGVSMTRLRMMMQQEVYEIETAGYIIEEEQYTTAVRNCKAIRDTAVAAEAVLVTVATGGAGAAGTLSTVQKTVKVIEGVNTVLSVAESGVAVVNASIGTDDIPPVVDTVFKGNKVLSYVLLPKALMAGDVGSVVALMTPVDDGTDWYFNVNANADTVKVSTKPDDPASQARHDERRDVLDDLLLPGDYQLPKKSLTTPTKSNSGFSFVEDPTSDDDFVLDAVNMADLWDLPDAPQDTMSWDTEAKNPDSSMEHVSSLGIDTATNPLGSDPLLNDPALADAPAVTVIASPASGDAPLIVTFSAQVANPTGEALTYTWHYGDGGYEQSALSYPDHTYTDAGTFRVTVYVKGAQLGQLMGGTTVVVSLGAVIPDGDVDIDSDPNATEWSDPSTGLVWQVGHGTNMTQDEAVSYCAALTIDGHGGWRLPSIDELRTLIAGCPATQTGGSCPLTNACMDINQCHNSSCGGCGLDVGPGKNGCYWNAALDGECSLYHWSSSKYNNGAQDIGLAVWFCAANVTTEYPGDRNLVKCVR